MGGYVPRFVDPLFCPVGNRALGLIGIRNSSKGEWSLSANWRIVLVVLGLESIRKSQKLLHARFSSSARGGGLEPHFRVLFSAIFQGVTLVNFRQGRNVWK